MGDVKDMAGLGILAGGLLLLYVYKDQIKSFFGGFGIGNTGTGAGSTSTINNLFSVPTPGTASPGDNYIVNIPPALQNERTNQGAKNLTDIVKNPNPTKNPDGSVFVNPFTLSDGSKLYSTLLGVGPVSSGNQLPMYPGYQQPHINVTTAVNDPWSFLGGLASGVGKTVDTGISQAGNFFTNVGNAGYSFVSNVTANVPFLGGLFGIGGEQSDRIRGSKTIASTATLTEIQKQALQKPVLGRNQIDKGAINEANKAFALDAVITRQEYADINGVKIFRNYSKYLPDGQATGVNPVNNKRLSGNLDTLLEYLGKSPSVKPGMVRFESSVNAGNAGWGLNNNATPDGIRRTGTDADQHGYHAAANSRGVSANNQVWFSDSMGHVSFAGQMYGDPETAWKNIDNVLYGRTNRVQYVGDTRSGGGDFGAGAIGSAGSAMNDFMSGALSGGVSYADALNEWGRS